MSIRLLNVDDQELMRDGLVTILNRQDDIEVVGAAADGREAVQKARETAPDVVLMDVRMPIMDGVTATGRLRDELPGCRVVMLTTFNDEEYIIGALQAGAVGYVLKNTPIDDLAGAVRMAYRGVVQLDPEAAAQIVGVLNSVSSSSPDSNAMALFQNLTEREREVAHLVAEGANNREIADALFVSEGTVKTHVSRILNQLGLRDRTQLAIFIYRNRLV